MDDIRGRVMDPAMSALAQNADAALIATLPGVTQTQVLDPADPLKAITAARRKLNVANIPVRRTGFSCSTPRRRRRFSTAEIGFRADVRGDNGAALAGRKPRCDPARVHHLRVQLACPWAPVACVPQERVRAGLPRPGPAPGEPERWCSAVDASGNSDPIRILVTIRTRSIDVLSYDVLLGAKLLDAERGGDHHVHPVIRVG